MRLRGVLVLVVLFACGGNPWRVKDAPNVPPDEQFRTGTEAGEDVYVWQCYEGSRIVVSQWGSACYGSRAPIMEKGACGAPLPVESKYPSEVRKELLPPQRWPGSPGATSTK
jgi:hypothetical protein